MADEAALNRDVALITEHLRRYVDSDGEEGHEFQGVSTLLLTIRGRLSGQLRRNALIYGRDGDDYVVVASKSGSDRHPLWYLNLLEHPHVEVQVGREKFTARARTAGPDERPRLWDLMTSVWRYQDYQDLTERELPVVVLVRTS